MLRIKDSHSRGKSTRKLKKEYKKDDAYEQTRKKNLLRFRKLFPSIVFEFQEGISKEDPKYHSIKKVQQKSFDSLSKLKQTLITARSWGVINWELSSEAQNSLIKFLKVMLADWRICRPIDSFPIISRRAIEKFGLLFNWRRVFSARRKKERETSLRKKGKCIHEYQSELTFFTKIIIVRKC